MSAYYNEFDPYAAAWLRNLIAGGHIAPGDVDERSIVDVRPDDLKDYTQVHFFAGIGGWSLGLRLAGWPDDKPVWTGSCPCQPFSAAGKQKGEEDDRHLWPVFAGLIRKCRPPTVFGEQVASRLGREWLAGVRTDLEDMAYAVGAADLCAAGAGSPHIRQRLWWVADNQIERRGQGCADAGGRGEGSVATQERPRLADGSVPSRLADADGGFAGYGDLQPGRQHGQQPEDGRVSGLGNTDDARSQGRRPGRNSIDQLALGPTGVGGFWSRYDVVHCTDGKARRFEPGSFPLAHGATSRVGRLRAYGNAIVPQVAAEFIRACGLAKKSTYCPLRPECPEW